MTPLRRTILIVASSGLGALLLLGLFVLLPLQESLVATHEALQHERVNREIVRLQEQDIQTSQREYNRLQSTAGTLRGFSVSEKNILTFISELESLAAETSVEQNIHDLQTPIGSAKESSFPLALHGSTENLLAYVAGLQRLNTYVMIDALSFSRSADAPTRTVELTLNIRIRWQ